MVIELQAQFGNKWAKIATYLQGRTDNDVKNFWSTRRKRMERIKNTPSPLKSRTTNKGKKVLLHQLQKVGDKTVLKFGLTISIFKHYLNIVLKSLRMVCVSGL